MTDTDHATPAAAAAARPSGDADDAHAILADMDTRDHDQLRAAVEDLRVEHRYRGRLTMRLLWALQPLLYTPIAERYIKTTPSVTGKPYVSTGIRSVQPQVDLMNAVLGRAHWRMLRHHEYSDEHGMQCRVHVIVGNRLASARLDAAGHLLANDAEILASDDGWGGQKNGTSIADLKKGSETNAAKRVIAHFGPGAKVYCYTIDAELHGGGDRYQGAETAAPGHASAAPAPASDAKETASDGQQRLIIARKIKHGINDAQLFNIVRAAAGAPPIPAQRVTRDKLKEALERLPAALVDPVLMMVDGRMPMPPMSQADAAEPPAAAADAGNATVPAPEPGAQHAPTPLVVHQPAAVARTDAERRAA